MRLFFIYKYLRSAVSIGVTLPKRLSLTFHQHDREIYQLAVTNAMKDFPALLQLINTLHPLFHFTVFKGNLFVITTFIFHISDLQ